ncbi:MAG: ribosome maturation factor RimP [Clostridia bacterium]|nr:ribosome maturation factor RimP [Clostridia bacterium]MDD4376282.1 ribosome maturation factor RimP [Clostridia bacterium]
MSQKLDIIENKIKDDVIKIGVEIEYTELVKEGENNIYRIVIDKPGVRVSIEDCEALSRAVEDKVDSLLKVDGYILEVSSAGIEKKLKNIRLYEKYKGNKIRVKLFKKVDEKKEIIGILEEVSENVIVINGDNKRYEINIKDIADANTVYDFGGN